MKILTAILLGMLSGILAALGLATLLAIRSDPGDLTTSVVNFFLLALATVVGWLASTLWMLQRAPSLSIIFRRGFLLGAAEGLAMIPLNLFSQARLAASHEGALSNAGAIGLGLAVVAGFGFAVGMSVICLICFAVAYFIGRETEAAAANIQCPSCAETIKAAARKCRFCDADIAATVPSLPSTEQGRWPAGSAGPVGKVLLGIAAIMTLFLAAGIWSVWEPQQPQKPKVVMTPEAQSKHNQEIKKLIEESRKKMLADK